MTIAEIPHKVRYSAEKRWRLMRHRQLPLPSVPGRPRILYFIVAYPTFSETYMHEEIRALSQQFDIKIITYRESMQPRRHSWEHTVIEYKAPCLVYGDIEEINLDFDDPGQADFLRQVDGVIEEFRPDILHGHYLGMAALLKKLSEKHRIPFTLRTHSMDVLSEPAKKLEAYCRACDSPWCERVLAFPASCDRLIERGMDREKLRSVWPIVNFARFYKPEPRPPTGRVMCAGPAIEKKAHQEFIDLAALMRDRGDLRFRLYGSGPTVRDSWRRNRATRAGVTLTYADPDDMPEVYPAHDWLVYPSDPEINKVGLPVVIVEAQASGIGVCWQELPGRRQEQLDFLGGGGFLYNSIEELPEILSKPYPETMRQAGFEAARRCDIEQHKHLLTDGWSAVAAHARATSA